jgi:hypothetical protein
MVAFTVYILEIMILWIFTVLNFTRTVKQPFAAPAKEKF